MKSVQSHAPPSPRHHVYDIAIVGAGPAGSYAAAALATRGWQVLLVEKDTFPRHKVCGEFLSPEAQATLRAANLYTMVAAMAPCSLHGAALFAMRGRPLEMMLPEAAWGLSRHVFDATLTNAAVSRGATLWSGTIAFASTSHLDGYKIGVRRGNQEREVRCRMLLLAGGRNLRSALYPTDHAIPSTAATTNQRRAIGIKRHYHNLAMPNRVELFLFHGGYVGINPVEGQRANLCLLTTYSAFAQAGRSVDALLNAATQQNPVLRERLASANPLPETECAVAPVDTCRPATPWVGAPCIGDTVTMIPPLCGDGMAMALRSAELCVPLVDLHLQGQFSERELAKIYTHQWHSEFDARLRTGRILERMLTQPTMAAWLLRVGQLLPGLAQWAVRATRGPVLPNLSAVAPVNVPR